jgi:putative peptidoglycan lipid II flippase
MIQRPSVAGGQGARSVAYRIVRATFVVLFFWLFWKFGGYVITALVVRRFGSGVVSDAYFFATQAVVYGLIFAPALAVLVPAFVPVFIRERNERGEEAAWRLVSTLLTLLLAGCGLLVASAYAWTGPITNTLVRGFDAESRALGMGLLRWLLPGAALMVVFLLLRAVLNSYKVFSYPSAAEALQKLIWVAVFAGAVWLLGVWAVVAGFLAGSVVMVGVAAFGLGRRWRWFRPGLPALSGSRAAREVAIGALFCLGTVGGLYGAARLLPDRLAHYRDLACMTVVLAAVLLYAMQLWARARRRAGSVARFAVLAVPLVISTFFAAYRNVVTFHFQSFTLRGVFSDIEGARKITNFPIELVALALSVAMLPYLCELASRRDHALLADIVSKALRLLAVGFVPLTVMTLILAEPVCRLVLDRGDRSALHIQYTARALQFLAAGLVVYAAERVIMQAYFSLQRMWTPALLGIGATVLQVGFLIVPIRAMGLSEPEQVFVFVALAYPVSRLAKNACLLGVLKVHLPVLPWRETLWFAGRLALLSAAVGAAATCILRLTEGAVPYDEFRQRKVVVATFEPEAEGERVAPAGRVVRLDSTGAGRQPGHALRLPAGGLDWGFAPPLDTRGTGRFRCRLLSDGEGALQALVTVRCGGEPGSRRVELPPGRWVELDATPAELGMGAPSWRQAEGLEVRWPAGGGPVYLDDVTFRRPARPLPYAGVMFVHCALPSLAGLAVMLALLRLLRFPELDQVVAWVRSRGWRRASEDMEEGADASA